jgi:hypothetical protein
MLQAAEKLGFRRTDRLFLRALRFEWYIFLRLARCFGAFFRSLPGPVDRCRASFLFRQSSPHGVVDDLLRLFNDQFQMGLVPEALGVDLVDVLRA